MTRNVFIGATTFAAATALVIAGVLTEGRSSSRGTVKETAAKPAQQSAWEGGQLIAQSLEKSPLQRLGAAMDIDLQAAREVGISIAPDTGRLLRLYRAPSQDRSKECIVLGEPLFGASCLRGGLFADKPVAYLVWSDGGPAIRDIREAHVAGLVSPEVDHMELLATDGTSVTVPLTGQRAFFYTVPQAELRQGIAPVTLLAVGADGQPLESIPVLP